MLEGELLGNPDPSTTQTIYVEYGAGKAGLSSFVAAKLAEIREGDERGGAASSSSQIKFLVIDRDSRRFKKDKQVKGAGFEVERQKFDIADFDLVKYTEIKKVER